MKSRPKKLKGFPESVNIFGLMHADIVRLAGSPEGKWAPCAQRPWTFGGRSVEVEWFPWVMSASESASRRRAAHDFLGDNFLIS